MQQEAEKEFVTTSNKNSAEDFKGDDIFPYVQPYVCNGEIVEYKSFERLFYWDNPRPLTTAKEDWRTPVITKMTD